MKAKSFPWVLAALVVFGGGTAQARDDGRYANSPLKPWFESLQSKGGGKCCANADGLALSDVDWDAKTDIIACTSKGNGWTFQMIA
jgi:hypothetical protein